MESKVILKPENVDGASFGLEEVRASQIRSVFTPLLDTMADLEVEYNEVMAGENSEERSKKAGSLRKKYVKVRTSTAKIHKEQKAFYLAGGRFVDGLKNAQLFASQGIEEKLSEVEDYYKNLEIERVRLRNEDRLKKIEEFKVPNVEKIIEAMDDDVFENYLGGLIAERDREIERSREIEREEIARKVRIDAENMKITKERLRIEEEKRIVEEKQRLADQKLIEERQKFEAEKKAFEDEKKRLEDEKKRLEDERNAPKYPSPMTEPATMPNDPDEEEDLARSQERDSEDTDELENEILEEFKAEENHSRQITRDYVRTLISVEKPSLEDEKMISVLKRVNDVLSGAEKYLTELIEGAE